VVVGKRLDRDPYQLKWCLTGLSLDVCFHLLAARNVSSAWLEFEDYTTSIHDKWDSWHAAINKSPSPLTQPIDQVVGKSPRNRLCTSITNIRRVRNVIIRNRDFRRARSSSKTTNPKHVWAHAAIENLYVHLLLGGRLGQAREPGSEQSHERSEYFHTRYMVSW
jgi:hypothetical protein